MSQIQISYFSRHFYVVNVILLSVLHFWTNFDTKKILFIFYDSFFKAMTFSECPEAFQEISDRLVLIQAAHTGNSWLKMMLLKVMRSSATLNSIQGGQLQGGQFATSEV